LEVEFKLTALQCLTARYNYRFQFLHTALSLTSTMILVAAGTNGHKSDVFIFLYCNMMAIESPLPSFIMHNCLSY